MSQHVSARLLLHWLFLRLLILARREQDPSALTAPHVSILLD
jgi:hypothetical protein